MSLFGRSTGSETDRRLEERVAALEKRVDGVEVEWSEWFDKFRRLYARIAKRQERDEVADKAPGSPATPRAAADAAPTHAQAANGLRRNLRGF